MLMAHLDYLRELEISGRIEEMFIHEAANACLHHHHNVIVLFSKFIVMPECKIKRSHILSLINKYLICIPRLQVGRML